jgi:hypothetical protein
VQQSLYRPGELAPFDGIYGAFKYGEHLPSMRIRLRRGEPFPANAGWLFKLHEPDPPNLKLVEPPDEVDSGGDDSSESSSETAD